MLNTTYALRKKVALVMIAVLTLFILFVAAWGGYRTGYLTGRQEGTQDGWIAGARRAFSAAETHALLESNMRFSSDGLTHWIRAENDQKVSMPECKSSTRPAIVVAIRPEMGSEMIADAYATTDPTDHSWTIHVTPVVSSTQPKPSIDTYKMCI